MKFKNLIFIEDDLNDYLIFEKTINDYNDKIKCVNLIENFDDILSAYERDNTIVFVDLNVNGKSGFNIFTQYVHKYEFITYVLSSSDNPEEIQKAQILGFNGFLKKGLDLEDTKRVLTTLINYWENCNHFRPNSEKMYEYYKDSLSNKITSYEQQILQLNKRMKTIQNSMNYPNFGNSLITKEDEKDKLYVNLINSYSMGVFVYSFETNKVFFVNQRYTELTGYSLSEINKMTEEDFYGLFADEDITKLNQHMEEIRNDSLNKIYVLKYKFKSKSGEYIELVSMDRAFERNDKAEPTTFIGNFFLSEIIKGV